ncbi:amidohydrolase family protein [Brucella abortus]|nr:amidohydrolase family protein [Brucella abortus]
MEPGAEQVEAVAVTNGVISAAGSKAEILDKKATDVLLVDLKGRTLLPGFIDPHMHTIFSYFEDWLDMGPFVNGSYEQIMDKLRADAKAAKPGDWVRGWQYDPSITPGAQPITLALLDEIAPNNPLLSSKATVMILTPIQKRLNWPVSLEDTQDPPEGRYIKDKNGNLSGRIEEYPAFVPLWRRCRRFPPMKWSAVCVRSSTGAPAMAALR